MSKTGAYKHWIVRGPYGYNPGRPEDYTPICYSFDTKESLSAFLRGLEVADSRLSLQGFDNESDAEKCRDYELGRLPTKKDG